MVGRLLNYLLFPLYTRVFVPAAYGVVTELYAYVTFLIVVYTYGMETAYFRFASKASTPEEAERVYATGAAAVWASTAVLTVAALGFAQPMASALGYASHPEYVRWFALVLAFDTVAALPFARLRQQNRALRYALLKLFNIGVNVVLNLVLLLGIPAVLAHSPHSALAQTLSRLYDPTVGVGYVFLATLGASATTLLLLLPELRLRQPPNRALLRQLLAFALPLLVAGLAGMVNETLDRLVLKRLLPGTTLFRETQLGIYGGNYKLAMLMTLFTQTFRMAAEPFFFAQASNANPQAVYATVTHWFTLAGCLIFLGVTQFIDLFKLLEAPAYWPGLWVAPVLLLANLCLGIYQNLSVWYKVTGQTQWGVRLSFIGAAITLTGLVLSIPRFGYGGAAVTTLVCYLAMLVLCYRAGQRHYPVPYATLRLGAWVGAACALAAATWPLPLWAKAMAFAAYVAAMAVLELRKIGKPIAE